MDIVHLFFDFALHVDRHLADFVVLYGMWVYALLFLIVFTETGVVVMPFLPGDSLLFVVGALCGVGIMSLPLAVAVLLAAAILGNHTNYTIGRIVGPRAFDWEHSRIFNKRAFNEAHAFYEKYGGATLVIGRFMPFVRTFAPFVAGVAEMSRAKFMFYDVVGGSLWVLSLTMAGYLFGDLPIIKNNFEKIIWGTIVIPGLIVMFGAWKAARRSATSSPLRGRTHRSPGPPPGGGSS